MSPLSAGVGRVVEQTVGVDTFQITPSLGNDASQQSSRFYPGARLTIGKRISNRAYLTYSRALGGSGAVRLGKGGGRGRKAPDYCSVPHAAVMRERKFRGQFRDCRCARRDMRSQRDVPGSRFRAPRYPRAAEGAPGD